MRRPNNQNWRGDDPDEFDDRDEWSADGESDWKRDADEVADVRECRMCGCSMYADADKCPLCGEWHERPHHVWQGRPFWWCFVGLCGIGAVIVASVCGFWI